MGAVPIFSLLEPVPALISFLKLPNPREELEEPVFISSGEPRPYGVSDPKSVKVVDAGADLDGDGVFSRPETAGVKRLLARSRMLELVLRQKSLKEFAVNLDDCVGCSVTIDDEDVDDGLCRKDEGPPPLVNGRSIISGRGVLVE